MRIAVTGREGQVVRSLIERAPKRGHEVVPLGRPDFDLRGDAETIRGALAAVSPDAIVSAAAYTAVDRAESESDVAFAVNEHGARAVAQAARSLDVPLIHLSTDYVFSGSKAGPYLESDATDPAGVYGASKLAGERAVREAFDNSAIVRTGWVYSPFATNFAKTMLRIGANHDEVAVVADQRGNPTSALDIADGLLSIAANLVASDKADLRGVFHMTADGQATWADFAEAIFSASGSINGPTARVRRIGTAEYPTAAKRPSNSSLDCSKVERVHSVRLPEWRTSVPAVVRRLVRELNSVGASRS
ncbi:MAG: dTDP-4-dehydrorhamnose reductase [Sphingomicrobium sp.]